LHGGQDLSIFPTEPARKVGDRKSRIAAIHLPDVREVDPGSMMLSKPIGLGGHLQRGVDSLAWPHGDVPLEARGRRPQPLVDLGWAQPMVSVFVTATFKGGTNSLPQEIQVGRVVASVGDASIELLLPFGRSGRQLFWSGGSAVVGVDAIGGPPHGDFTNESCAQGTALRHPIGADCRRGRRDVEGGRRGRRSTGTAGPGIAASRGDR
jgi:hypothetical protein